MTRKPETQVTVEAEEPIDELAADVYEGDLHALQELRRRSAEPQPPRGTASTPPDADSDGEPIRDSLWPLIR